MKHCSKCKEVKEFSEFCVARNKKSGYSSHCKTCLKEARENNKEVIKARNAERYRKNRERLNSQSKEYRVRNKETIRKRKRDHYLKNKDSIRERQKEYYRKNKEKFTEYSRQRRGVKVEATPLWLTDSQKAHTKRTYNLCTLITDITGIEYHVDHIVPLQGKNVCGLHVPWNLQVIPASENRRKSNSISDW